jgi:methylenetetrahydrofolate dehydrogenase (NADP+)/methenyltetrahydrofolate cyclohydrolase
VIEILNKIDVGGDAPWRVSTKNIVLIGKPSIFTVPLIHYFSQKNKFQVSSFKFQVLSPVDPDLQKKSRQADILITAVGHPHLIKKEMIKKGAIVIDIGISRLRGKVVGDIDFKNVIPQCSWITPVPGGVGPVTVAVLLRNVVKSALLFFGEAQ